MKKSELIGLIVRDKKCSRKALGFARQFLSDEAIKEMYVPAQKRKLRWDNIFFYGALALSLVLSVALLVTSTGPRPEVLERVGEVLAWGARIGELIFSVLGLVLGLMLFSALVVQGLGYEHRALLLTPISSTSRCGDGLVLIQEEGPPVAAWRELAGHHQREADFGNCSTYASHWRDRALQERNQLYIFDLEIMQALARVQKIHAAQERQRAAWRELHNRQAH